MPNEVLLIYFYKSLKKKCKHFVNATLVNLVCLQLDYIFWQNGIKE